MNGKTSTLIIALGAFVAVAGLTACHRGSHRPLHGFWLGYLVGDRNHLGRNMALVFDRKHPDRVGVAWNVNRFIGPGLHQSAVFRVTYGGHHLVINRWGTPMRLEISANEKTLKCTKCDISKFPRVFKNHGRHGETVPKRFVGKIFKSVGMWAKLRNAYLPEGG